MSYGGVDCGPWHTLKLSDAVWYCDLVREDDPAACVPQADCKGHNAPHPGRTVEQDRELEHPAECVPPPCCCKETDPAWLAEHIDPECLAGRHDDCLNRDRCWTQRDLFEWWDIEEMPTAAGVYRVRAWGSGPDYAGEYDAGIDWEPVDETEGGRDAPQD